MKLINKQSMQKQQGIALLMSLIMLLLITVIGVASVRMSSLDTQVSGNSMFSLMVFQGAESALGKVASNDDISNIRDAAISGGTITIPATYFSATEAVNGGVQLISSAEMKAENKVSGSLFSSTPNSTSFDYQIFRTTAISRLNATSARAKHSEGIAIQSASD
ncbi:MAG: PilX N-terminal domain-containing pilus assembly protein [Cocleimonas sp.]